jgi:hypothetical protein
MPSSILFNFFIVVDAENLAQFQAVGVVDTVPREEDVLVVQRKGAETLFHHSRVESFHSEDNGKTLLDSHEQRFREKTNNWRLTQWQMSP